MHVREGATENTMLSSDAYITTFIDGDYEVGGVQQRRTISPILVRLSEKLNNYFEINSDYNGQEVTIKYKDYINNAKESVVPAEGGKNYLKLVEASDGERHDHWIGEGEVLNIHNILVSFNNQTEGAINLMYKDGIYSIASPFEGEWMRMADKKKGELLSDSIQPLNLRSLYQVANMSFVIPDPVMPGDFGIVKAPKDEPTNMSAVTFEISSNGESKTVYVLGGQGVTKSPVVTELAGLKIYLAYGSKE